jgi:hypothetical protein
MDVISPNREDTGGVASSDLIDKEHVLESILESDIGITSDTYETAHSLLLWVNLY